MNKIISPIVLVILLIWTWQVVHVPAAIGFETHSGIQLELMKLIQATLQAKKPEAKDLEIIKMWTTQVGPHKVKADFTYRFTEAVEDKETAQKTIQGEAMLYNEPTEDVTINKWVLQSVKTSLEAMNFAEGSEVSGNGEEAAPAAETAPAPQEQPKSDH